MKKHCRQHIILAYFLQNLIFCCLEDQYSFITGRRVSARWGGGGFSQRNSFGKSPWVGICFGGKFSQSSFGKLSWVGIGFRGGGTFSQRNSFGKLPWVGIGLGGGGFSQNNSFGKFSQRNIFGKLPCGWV